MDQFDTKHEKYDDLVHKKNHDVELKRLICERHMISKRKFQYTSEVIEFAESEIFSIMKS